MSLVKLTAERTARVQRDLEQTRRVLAKLERHAVQFQDVLMIAFYHRHATRLENALIAGEIEIPGL